MNGAVMAKRTVSARAAKVLGFPLRVSSAVQGYHLVLKDPEEVADWLEREISYWRDKEFITSPSEGATSISEIYVKNLEALDPNNVSTMKSYFDQADKLQLVVGTGALGSALREVQEYDPQGAVALLVALTQHLDRDLLSVGIDYRQSIRAGLLVAPAMLAGRGLRDLGILTERSKAAALEFDEAKSEFDNRIRGVLQSVLEDRSRQAHEIAELETRLSTFVTETEADLTRIRDLYHKHVQTEAAATYWSDRAKRAWWAGVCSFVAFTTMVIGPLALGYANLDALKAFIIEIGTTTQGQLSLTPIVAITVPVLAYGWILRHISRLFIQSFAQADDARYRNVMTMTFLGLSKDKTSGVTDAERGIIINALFRPTPPNAAEDGPPNGLLDLIRGAKQ